jgi:hypothetical protein
VAEGLVFVELAPDVGGLRRDAESLAARRFRPPPAWLVRLAGAGPRIRYAALVAVLVGGLLAADQTQRLGAYTAGLVYAGAGHCPVSVSCQVTGRPRQDMWASYNALFANSRQIGGSVWYDAASGVVYFQELDAGGGSGQRITLRQQRLDSQPIVSFGPTVDVTPGLRHGRSGPGTGRREVLVTARRGPWLVTAALSGPWGVYLPVQDAVQWTAVAPLPD